MFSGIGGFALAAMTIWVNDYETVGFVEREKFCQDILRQRFPNTKIIEDIRECVGKDFGKIDLITGGFPCQPFSIAGKQKGNEDDRYLWPTMLKVIAQQRPTWIIGENVTGIIGMALDKVLFDLESEGYTTRTFVIPACAVNAPHRRDRVWVVAYSSSKRAGGESGEVNNKEWGASQDRGKGLRQIHGETCTSRLDTASTDVADTESIEPREQTEREGRQDIKRGSPYPRGVTKAWGERKDFFKQFPTQPPVCRRDDGLPDRVGKLKALGNSIVPQVAMKIMAAIKATE